MFEECTDKQGTSSQVRTGFRSIVDRIGLISWTQAMSNKNRIKLTLGPDAPRIELEFSPGLNQVPGESRSTKFEIRFLQGIPSIELSSHQGIRIDPFATISICGRSTHYNVLKIWGKVIRTDSQGHG